MDRESIMGIGFQIKMRPPAKDLQSNLVFNNKSQALKKRDSRSGVT